MKHCDPFSLRRVCPNHGRRSGVEYMGMDQNKFAAFAATIVSGGTLALANNLGFRGNCEIQESDPVCKTVGADPPHTHQEAPTAYGTNTTTLSNSGSGDVTVSLTGQSAAFTAGSMSATATMTGTLSVSSSTAV